MRAIKLCPSNSASIKSVLNSIQKIGIDLRIIGIGDISIAVEEIERRLSNILEKKDWIDIYFCVDLNAYELCHRPERHVRNKSTIIVIIRKKTGWFLKTIYRGKTRNYAYEISGLADKKTAITDFLSHPKNFLLK